MFVDDNILVALYRSIKLAVAGSLGSAYDCFGSPDDNWRRGSVISRQKFEPEVAVAVFFLGLLIDNHSMTVTWHPDKRENAHKLLDEWLGKRTARAPRELAQLLGILRHGAFLSAAGNFLSIRLQWILSTGVTASNISTTDRGRSRRWWSGNRLLIPPSVYSDLRLLQKSLQEPEAAVLWSRPIGLLVNRAPTVTLLSDASDGGIGGWSRQLGFLWRITRDELHACGIPMRLIDSEGEALTLRPSPADADGLHINLLEFIAIIINVWLALSWVRSAPTHPGGHIIAILADNTSALVLPDIPSRKRHRPAHTGTAQRRGGCSLPPRKVPDAGLRYPSLLPAADLSDFPDTIRSLIVDSQSGFVDRDRGRTRQRNDSTFASRAEFFGSWLHRNGLDFSRILQKPFTPGQGIALLGAFMDAVAKGDNLSQRSDISDDTIRQYLSAAVSYLRSNFAIDVPIFDSIGHSTRDDKLHPYLAELLAARRTWKKPQQKKEPLSGPALDSMADLARTALATHKHGWLSQDVVLYDFCSLSIFTDSRIAEFGQSGLPSGSPSDGWNRVPVSRDVPEEWRGLPMAFIASDFSFFDKRSLHISHADALACTERVRHVHVRFWCDTSNFNFSIRKFRCVPRHHLCPVRATLRILAWAYLGKLVDPATEPLGMFLGDNGRRYSIRGHHVANFLKRATLLAHPDPNHFDRVEGQRQQSAGSRRAGRQVASRRKAREGNHRGHRGLIKQFL
jgi:hypothetical protein